MPTSSDASVDLDAARPVTCPVWPPACGMRVEDQRSPEGQRLCRACQDLPPALLRENDR
jgi:hypothetical protein